MNGAAFVGNLILGRMVLLPTGTQLSRLPIDLVNRETDQGIEVPRLRLANKVPAGAWSEISATWPFFTTEKMTWPLVGL